MDFEIFKGLIVGLGFGAIATATIQYFLKKRESANLSQRRDLEKRYRVVILLMYAAYDFKGNATALRMNRPDLRRCS